MPGPVSDSYDPEWGTGAVRDEIDTALLNLYHEISRLLDGCRPMPIVELVRTDLPERTSRSFSEKELRLLRYSLERARESL